MTILPFHARRTGCSAEDLRQLCELSVPEVVSPAEKLRTLARKIESLPAAADAAPAIYTYEHLVDGELLRGVLCLLEPGARSMLRSPQPVDPVLRAEAAEVLASGIGQLSPVVALYDAVPLSGIEAAFTAEDRQSIQFGENDSVSVGAITDEALVTEFGAWLAETPLTVIHGQEWLQRDDSPLLVLLVNVARQIPALAPVHRYVRWRAEEHAGEMVRLGRGHFYFFDISRWMPELEGDGPHYFRPTIFEQLMPKQDGEHVVVSISPHHSFRCHCLSGWADKVLSYRMPEERDCDSVLLHNVLFPIALILEPGSDAERERLRYSLSMDDAVEMVRREPGTAFLMNPPSIPQVCEVALSGGSLPLHAFAMRRPPLPGVILHAGL